MSQPDFTPLNTLAHLLDEPAGPRAAARRDLAARQLPGTKHEEWRFVRLKELAKAQVEPAQRVRALDPGALAEYEVPEAKGRQLVFVDGLFAEELSDLSALPEGVSLAVFGEDAAPQGLGEVVAHLQDGADYFVAMNAALWETGACLDVGKDVSAGTCSLLFVHTGSHLVMPRVHVRAGQGSKLTLVEEHVSLALGAEGEQLSSVTVAVVEADLAPSAHVKHVKVQDENLESFHIARTAVRVKEGADYTSVTLTFGAKLSRHDLHAQIEGGSTMAGLHGLTKIGGSQVSDTHSVMNHAHPNSESDQLHKCVVDDRAHAIFNGKIFVRQIAQQTNAFQLNRNLLRSRHAKIDTKPQLEIFADDVKCTHGATIGQLDEDQLFYLQTRGIGAGDAAGLLTYAFAAEVVERVPVLSVRKRLIARISEQQS